MQGKLEKFAERFTDLGKFNFVELAYGGKVLGSSYRQFYQHYSSRFQYKRRIGSFYYVHVTRKKAAEKTFVRKKRVYNVDEIDTCFSILPQLLLKMTLTTEVVKSDSKITTWLHYFKSVTHCIIFN